MRIPLAKNLKGQDTFQYFYNKTVAETIVLALCIVLDFLQQLVAPFLFVTFLFEEKFFRVQKIPL